MDARLPPARSMLATAAPQRQEHAHDELNRPEGAKSQLWLGP